ncbi:MAG: hypothetical protein O2962_03515, partial [Cyanobacteria bacterium]|nr:hypothetical protein [Cyanobacteriota bacterium]
QLVESYKDRTQGLMKIIPGIDKRIEECRQKLGSMHQPYPYHDSMLVNLRSITDCFKISLGIIHKFLDSLTSYQNNGVVNEDIDDTTHHQVFRLMTNTVDRGFVKPGHIAHWLDGNFEYYLSQFTGLANDIVNSHVPCSDDPNEAEREDEAAWKSIGDFFTNDFYEFAGFQQQAKELFGDLRLNLDNAVRELPRNKELKDFDPQQYLQINTALYFIMCSILAGSILESIRNRLIDHRFRTDPDNAANLDHPIEYYDYVTDHPKNRARELELRQEYDRANSVKQGLNKQMVKSGLADCKLEQLRTTGFDFDIIAKLLNSSKSFANHFPQIDLSHRLDSLTQMERLTPTQ